MTTVGRTAARHKRHERIRLTLAGTSDRPRLAIFRSTKHIYAQVIDDSSGTTVAAASTLESGLRGSGSKTEEAKGVGTRIAERAKSAGIERVVFDRAGFRYHGRVRAVADAAREAGLEF
ncbi:MAG TPA: 50S ribosomal protein L18 [Candidatus Limnocylindrales bacterium]|nr:50S ribosomal protein L18 [Candidatus Limnocylindrales bacterium]